MHCGERQTPPTPSSSYLLAATEWALDMKYDTYMRRELQWQTDESGGNFQGQRAAAVGPAVFWVMQTGLPFIKIMYSPFIYVNPHGDLRLQNKTIGFMGDRHADGDPVLVILAPLLSWE